MNTLSIFNPLRYTKKVGNYIRKVVIGNNTDHTSSNIVNPYYFHLFCIQFNPVSCYTIATPEVSKFPRMCRKCISSYRTSYNVLRYK